MAASHGHFSWSLSPPFSFLACSCPAVQMSSVCHPAQCGYDRLMSYFQALFWFGTVRSWCCVTSLPKGGTQKVCTLWAPCFPVGTVRIITVPFCWSCMRIRVHEAARASQAVAGGPGWSYISELPSCQVLSALN